MPNAFDLTNPPFDRLTPPELERLRQHLDIGYFRPAEAIVAQGAPADSLFVIIKGIVEERNDGELISLLGPKDTFDSHALVQGQGGHAFVAREETLCYLLPRQVVLNLVQGNPRFAAFFYLELSRKLDAVARDEEDSHTGVMMRARIRDVALAPAVFADANDSVEAIGHRMAEAGVNALFVRDGDRVGIVTGMNLSKAAILQKIPLTAPVGPVAHFDVIALTPDDFVYSALILMTKTNKRRIAIRQGDTFTGILEDIHLLGFLAGNAQLVAGRIDRAATLPDLAAAATEIAGQVRLLRRQGVKVEAIAEVVSDLNRRLFAKVFHLLAPPEWRDKACLIVMGSEGRGEQTVRTDQDNGLILAEPVDEALLARFRTNFTAALESFGFEPCPGNVMVRNPVWSQTLAAYRDAFRRRVALPSADAHMDVAIFYDAVAVAGNAGLLAEAKASLIEAVGGRSAFMVHFARAIDSFPPAIGFFNTLRMTGEDLDLKKGGIFPIVHGVRSLALEHGLLETNTAQRIRHLADTNIFSRDFAGELTQSLHYLMTLRLDGQLEATGPMVHPREMSSMQRDLLRDSLRVVKQFHEIVRHHFNLGSF
jgi:CBS domain-containing protein